MSLDDIKQIKKETLSIAQVAAVLGVAPQYIRTQARQDKTALGFPVILYGRRTKIPKAAFIRFCEGGITP